MKFELLKLFSLFLLIGLTSCSGLQTFTDYDETLDFEELNSFEFFDPLESGMDELDEKRFKSAVADILQEKEVNLSEENPDFKINFYLEAYQKNHQHNIGLSVGTYGRSVSGSVGSGIPIRRTTSRMSITVEFVHYHNHELFWQGVVDAKANLGLNPEERTAYFKKLAKKLLKNYPPKTKTPSRKK